MSASKGAGASGAEKGSLVLVSTPIGNLGDMSERASQLLASADLICCEDTRRTRELLAHLGLKRRPLLSLHDHNEESRVDEIVARIDKGETVALVSDAGTPSISDPGARLVAAVAGEGLLVSAVPGPSALVMALVVSGLPTDRFCFEGFLPRKGKARRERLAAMSSEMRTMVLYESPVRLAGTLKDLDARLGGDTRVAVARELTKLHEEVWRGSLEEALEEFEHRLVRGEVVVVVAGSPEPEAAEVDDAEVKAALSRHLEAGESARDSAAAVSEELGIARRRAYGVAVSLRGGTQGSRNEERDRDVFRKES